MTGGTIELDHGAGGGLSRELIDELIAPHLGAAGAGRGEGAPLELDAARIAMTTCAFAVDPLFFTGGDIGRLAVCATVNELAAGGAVPRYLTLSLTIEQGLPVAELERVLDSARAAALEADVEVIAGDAEVVRRGEADSLFATCAGVGECAEPMELGVARVCAGDAVIVTGWLGNHGVDVLALREGLELEEVVPSDCAPLGGLVWNVLEDYAPQVRCMRDLTRGGLASVLGELAAGAGVSIELEEHRLPVGRETRLAATRLGVDPLHLPSGAALCLVVDDAAAVDVLELIRWQPQGQAARIVGTVGERRDGAVTLVRPDGDGATVLALRAGVELPRLW